MTNSVDFIVGNTYARIPNHMAKISRSGQKKIHDVTVFVDLQRRDNPDLIDKVSFDCGASFRPQVFVCHCPIQTKTRNGARVWRFSTRQQVYGAFCVDIKLHGAGGSVLPIRHAVQLNPNSEIMAHREAELTFFEKRPLRPLSKVRLPDNSKFGVELELSSSAQMTPYNLVLQLGNDSRYLGPFHHNYASGRVTRDHWMIVPDSSIACNRSQPDCNKFELVSPPLGPGQGLTQVHAILSKVAHSDVRVNKSMGFHVHVDVSGFDIRQLVKICQQFVKYEDVMDTFMPPSRRTGSDESNRYFASNRAQVMSYAGGRSVIETLEECEGLQSLAEAMNGSNQSRYFKLNLQNLVTGRQPTIEFRQHSATFEYNKVRAWISFCVWLVWNSARLRAPTSFSATTTIEDQFQALFQYVIKDRTLRDYYQKRVETHNHQEDEPCCDECAHK